MTTTTNATALADLTRVDVTGTGLTIAEASQGIAQNCSHYRSVEVWKVGQFSHASRYRVTITVGNDKLRYGPGTSAVVEVWCSGQGWREVLTLPAEDAALTGLPTPPVMLTEEREAVGDMYRLQVEDASHNLAQSAVAILS